MVLGARRGSTPLSPALIPNAYASYDPITRRKVRFIESIVPVLSTSGGALLPADRFYVMFGFFDTGAGADSAPAWFGERGTSGGGSVTSNNWQSSRKQPYLRLTGVGYFGNSEGVCLIYPSGFAGAASSYAPKNADVNTAIMQFTARFPDNVDYGVSGLGATTGGGSTTGFVTGEHFIQVTRNSGSWELGTCDGSTVSQSSGGTADGDFHEFSVRWQAAEIVLRVDGVDTITKTTNLPTEPMHARLFMGSSLKLDIVDYMVSWDLA